MEAKPAPLQQEGGAGFVEVEQQSDPIVAFLGRLGVVEADKSGSEKKTRQSVEPTECVAQVGHANRCTRPP